MTDLLFDPPLLLLAGLAVAGAVLAYSGLSRQNARLRWAGLGAIVAAVLIFVAGRLVETGRERVTRETKQFVAAADQRDWKTFAALLDPDVRFAMYKGRDELTRGAAGTVEAVGVKDVTVSGIEVAAEPGGYTVVFTATADVSLTTMRTPTNWKFYWAKNPAGGADLLYRIDVLPDPRLGTEPVLSRLARP